MADTGRTVFADGFFADGFFAVGFFAADEPVTVPDVDDPGTTQAAAVAAIEGVGLAAAVLTSYSSTIPAGEVISQDPAAGSSVSPGSTVTITVSLGEAPQPPDNNGGGGPDKSDSPEYWYWLERARKVLAEQAARRQQIRAETADIADEASREIATLIRKQEAKDEARKELTELQRFADTAARKLDMAPSPQLRELIRDAALMRTNTSLLTLQKELARYDEEEEALVVTLLLMN